MSGISSMKTHCTDMLDCLRLDPGTRTLGELLQERQWALSEIERLRGLLCASSSNKPPDPKPLLVEETRFQMRQRTWLRLSEVCERFGLARTTIYEYIKKNGFPKPIRIGFRAVRWRVEDVESWMASRIQR